MVSILKRNRLFLLGGILLSVLLAAVTGYIEFIKANDRTQEALEQEVGRIQDRLSIIDANMHAVVALISSGNTLQPNETDRFLTLLRSPVSQNRWLLVERVAASEVAQFEAAQRSRGLTDFTIFELSAAGTKAPVSGRDAYYPIIYDYGTGGAAAAPSPLIGFDVSSFAPGGGLLAGDGMQVSTPLSAPQSQLFGDQFLFAQTVPNSRRADAPPRGLVVRPLSAADFLVAGNRRNPVIAQISDITNADDPLHLFGETSADRVLGANVSVGNRTWRVAMMREPFGSILLAPATVLTLGLLLTALFLTVTETTGSRARARDLLQQIDRQRSDLRHSEDVYRSLFDNAGTANCETDPLTGRILKVNDRMCEMFGYSRDELLSMSLIDVTHPNDRQASIDMLAAIAAGGHDTLTLDKRYMRKDGSSFWALKTTRLSRDGDGRPTVCTTVIQDISQRKADEQAKTRLLRELAHRVRNTVQLMASLADQTAKSATSVESYRRNFQNRLRALKTAQDLLFEAEWRKVGLVELATSTLAPFQTAEHASAIDVALPAIDLPTQHAQTLAIAFHELASNAIQYGSLSRPAGRISLTGFVEKGSPDDAGEGVLVMTWQEKAGPQVTKPQRRGFGRVMLERVLATQFGGSTEISWKAEGIEFKARLPLANLESDSSAGEPLEAV
ncbi:MAG: PAS domain S-box protein [Hyphomicrobiales bacterium]